MSNCTIICVAREGFHHAERCLKELYSKTNFDLVYIESSGQEVYRQSIKRLQQKYNFELHIMDGFV